MPPKKKPFVKKTRFVKARLPGEPILSGAPFLKSQKSAAYAALDLGTNNCRLLIGQPLGNGKFRVVDTFSRVVRLGEGLLESGRLSKKAMERTVSALKVCQEKLRAYDVVSQRFVATEACRAAENGAEFIAEIEKTLGLSLEIVDQETEIRLAVAGCQELVEPEAQGIVLFDIGGGSSEIALLDVSRKPVSCLPAHIVAWVSLPVGVVTLTEMFGKTSPMSQHFTAMKKYVCRLLEGFWDRDKLGPLARKDNFYLIGTSGPITTLASLSLNLPQYDRKRVDGLWMEKEQIVDLTEKLLCWDRAARKGPFSLGAMRADLMIAGCAILEAIWQMWPSRRLRVADRGLREGILREMLNPCMG